MMILRNDIDQKIRHERINDHSILTLFCIPTIDLLISLFVLDHLIRWHLIDLCLGHNF